MDSQKNVDLSGETQIFDIIERAFARYGDEPAYTCLGQTLSFKEIDEKSQALARYIQQHTDLEPGDRFAIQLPNLIQFPIAAYAAFRCGLVLVNTNPLYTEREMKHQFKDSGAKGIIILADFLPKLTHIIDELEISDVIVTKAPDLLMPEQTSTDEYQHDGSIRYHCFNQALILGQQGKPLVAVERHLDDLLLLQYTGGTTGPSKGAMLTHSNLLANEQQTYERFCIVCNEGEETFVAPLPMYHIYGFTANVLMATSRGGHNVLIPNPRDLDALVTAIKPFPFSVFMGINTLFVGLCHHDGFKALDFSHLNLTCSGGSALTLNAAELWQQVTDCTISEGYGLSETSPVVSFNDPGREVIGSIGRPLMNTEVQIWDENNQALPTGEVGELVVKGPQVMRGYWQREDATKDSIINGYFKTGDVAIELNDGRYKIVDRKKDMINVSGFNVFPNEIEDVLSQYPEILEAAVIGKEDDHSGERVCAYIVLQQESSTTEAQVVDYCKTQLTSYKVPKEVHFIAELPKSTVGKVLRRELRQ